MSGRPARMLAAAALALSGSGCSLLFQGSPAAEQTYFLRAAAPTAPGEVPQARVSLRVMHPVADPGLESPRIVLLEAGHRMGFYAGSQWAASLPDLVEALTVATLRTSSSWSSVEDSASPFPSDYLLQITIRRFEADYGASEVTPKSVPRVHVVLECLLGRGDGRDVIASYVSEGTATPAENRLTEVVAAFQIASTEALRSLSEHAFEAVRNDPRRP